MDESERPPWWAGLLMVLALGGAGLALSAWSLGWGGFPMALVAVVSLLGLLVLDELEPPDPPLRPRS